MNIKRELVFALPLLFAAILLCFAGVLIYNDVKVENTTSTPLSATTARMEKGARTYSQTCYQTCEVEAKIVDCMIACLQRREDIEARLTRAAKRDEEEGDNDDGRL
eukprot:TRINITY_DN0_c1026_g1_i1.p1 TRINITY_DN0_c1026_g1~~TRINITY_DN0_c1026_g1_i1.p1  ORF type:complete len:106 (-),score=21.35 TRINITY_DN0_c1026_g1_i1:88-405(-)